MSTVKHPLRIALVAVALAVAAVLVAVTGRDSSQAAPVDRVAPATTVEVAAVAAGSTPRCFGAASMTRRRCHNPALAGRITPKPRDAHRDQIRTPGKQCYRAGTSQTTVNRGCTFGRRAAGRPHVILVGDSHGRALLPAFITMAEQGHISLEAQVRAACSWTRSGLKHPDKSRVKPCRAYRKNLSRWLVRQAPTTDMIVTTGYTRQIAGSRSSQIKAMRATWRPLIKRGVRIVALSDNPRLTRDPQRCLTRHGVKKGTRKCGVSTQAGFVRDPFLLTAKSTRGATAINLRSVFCRKGHCPAIIGGVNVYRDPTHLTRTYAATMAPILVKRFRAARLI